MANYLPESEWAGKAKLNPTMICLLDSANEVHRNTEKQDAMDKCL